MKPENNSTDALLVNSSEPPPSNEVTPEHPVVRAKTEIDWLECQIRDLQLALSTSNEHGDSLQDHLYRLSASLTAEIRERQAAELKLQKIVQAITREKGDLETLVQILADEGDLSAEEGEKARIDELTQIANRRRFDEYLLQEWQRHVRLQLPLSLLICDVDHFKLYNDHYGHQAGDACLKQVAASISRDFRIGDLAARYGGEEFGIVLPNTERAGAVLVAERVRASVAGAARPHAASSVSDCVTVSIGVASRIPRREDVGPRALIEEADRNLYGAKRLGRNRVSYQDEKRVEYDQPDTW
jgi:diguanylate cyclase (GGDEF)-like protein